MVSGPFGNLSLPPELERFVAESIASGRYQTADAIVTEALRMLRDYESWREDARQKITEGMAQAERGELLDGEEVMQRLRDKIDQARRGREEAA